MILVDVVPLPVMMVLREARLRKDVPLVGVHPSLVIGPEMLGITLRTRALQNKNQISKRQRHRGTAEENIRQGKPVIDEHGRCALCNKKKKQNTDEQRYMLHTGSVRKRRA